MKKSVNHCNQLYFLIEDREEERVMYSSSNFTFYLVQLMYCNCHQVNFKRHGSCIDFPDWIKNKKA